MAKPMKDKPAAPLCLFVATPELTVANFLHGSAFYKVDAGPFPLGSSSAVISRLGQRWKISSTTGLGCTPALRGRITVHRKAGDAES